ncbi:hypothetical protein [Parendozoicomonas haliclonae]|uniref:CS1 type fimbrial major subunit n=1 Tax=Parendozoicomonas haliclonae TaxID=1960125 RepID=A0A1X7AJL8_9GAMM|nr:hypothetical protein [Parendozoicomonas haliclonae]SMA45922.1 hypothetical protein EHSB41UT_02037 [Parendozoicomonas haliclonae]
MKEKILTQFPTRLISTLMLVSSLTAFAHPNNDAEMNMTVNADIPEFIQIGGLPSRVTLNITPEGWLASDFIGFYVTRNGASPEQTKKFLLTVDSSSGQRNKKYFLSHELGNKNQLAVRVGLTKGTTASLDELIEVPVSGLESETSANLSSKQKTHTLALFNKNTKYINSLIPGKYSATFTITVQAK